MERDDYGKDDKYDESEGVDGVFYGTDFRRTDSLEGRENRSDEKPAAVERGKRQEVERAQVDGKERRHGEDYRSADVFGNQFHEQSSDGDGSTHSRGRFLTLFRILRNDEFPKDFEQEFEGERRLVHRFGRGDDDGFPEGVSVSKTLLRTDIRIRNVGSDFSVFRNDRNRYLRTASG